MNAAFYRRRRFASWREFETIRVQIEESVFNRFHGTAVRGIDDVRVDVQRRCDARVPGRPRRKILTATPAHFRRF
jgi:hypothetical protein